jgi:hypothetical protein
MVKRAVMYLFAAGPVLLLGLIAINSRYSQERYEFVEYSGEAEDRIQAYILPIRTARSHFASAEHRQCREECPGVLAWLDAYRGGALKDIHPPTAAFEDGLPVYNSVLSERSRAMEQAALIARSLAESGKGEAAAKAFADVIELAETAKYSEFGSFVDSSFVQMDALRHISDLAKGLDEAQKTTLLSRIDGLQSQDRSLADTVDRLANVYRIDQARRGEMTTTLEAARDGYVLASVGDPTQEKIENWQTLIRSDQSVMTLYSQSQLAYVQNRRLLEQIEKTRADLTGVSSN